jgi:murein DD-endopeptidase MepM/ murein hydrolase activator NlpD
MRRTLLLLLVGVLAGANVVYFAMSRSRHDAGDAAITAAGAVQPAQAATPAPSTASSRSLSPPSPSPSTPANEPQDGADARPLPASKEAEPERVPTGVAAPEEPSGLLVPVQGVAADALVDTYADARSEGRSHDAIDIMAPAGTPVLAAADGHVEKLFTSERGGLTIYQFEPDGRYAYYYAHLQSYAPGLKEKQPLRRGEVIGYVGSTGNASPQAPHLHFAIFVLGPEKHWWEGTAIDPYPFLGGKPR